MPTIIAEIPIAIGEHVTERRVIVKPPAIQVIEHHAFRALCLHRCSRGFLLSIMWP